MIKYTWQEDRGLEVWTDSDWAGDVKTRKSTSGGVLRWGQNVIKHWSSTQHVIALSYAEAELYAIVKGMSQIIGIKQLMMDLGLIQSDIEMTVFTDASAAIGIVNRKGSGKVRHISTNELWVQDKVANKEIKVTKVPGEENLADGLTKPMAKKGIEKHIELVKTEIRKGRHECMLEVEKAGDDLQSINQDKVIYHVQQSKNKRYTVTPKDKEVQWDNVIERQTIDKTTGKVIERWYNGEEKAKYVKLSDKPIDTVTIFKYQL